MAACEIETVGPMIPFGGGWLQQVQGTTAAASPEHDKGYICINGKAYVFIYMTSP